VYPSQLTMLMIYSRYLNDIINNEYNAIDVYSKALQEHNILRSRQHIISSENEE